MNKLIPILVTSAFTVIPVGSTWAATAKPAPKPAATRTIKGPSENMRWGPVQVTLVVKGKRIMDIKATAPTERARSAFINNQVLPILRSEVLKAQSAKIDGISGATMTSEAYYLSLLAALKAAHL